MHPLAARCSNWFVVLLGLFLVNYCVILLEFDKSLWGNPKWWCLSICSIPSYHPRLLQQNVYSTESTGLTRQPDQSFPSQDVTWSQRCYNQISPTTLDTCGCMLAFHGLKASLPFPLRVRRPAVPSTAGNAGVPGTSWRHGSARAVALAAMAAATRRARKVAVVGGGPAGLAACRMLEKFGHHPTVFETSSILEYLSGMKLFEH